MSGAPRRDSLGKRIRGSAQGIDETLHARGRRGGTVLAPRGGGRLLRSRGALELRGPDALRLHRLDPGGAGPVGGDLRDRPDRRTGVPGDREPPVRRVLRDRRGGHRGDAPRRRAHVRGDDRRLPGRDRGLGRGRDHGREREPDDLRVVHGPGRYRAPVAGDPVHRGEPLPRVAGVRRGRDRGGARVEHRADRRGRRRVHGVLSEPSARGARVWYVVFAPTRRPAGTAPPMTVVAPQVYRITLEPDPVCQFMPGTLVVYRVIARAIYGNTAVSEAGTLRLAQ